MAAMMIPEPRLSQYYDTTEDTAINSILRVPGIERRRPQPSIKEMDQAAKRQLVRQ